MIVCTCKHAFGLQVIYLPAGLDLCAVASSRPVVLGPSSKRQLNDAPFLPDNFQCSHLGPWRLSVWRGRRGCRPGRRSGQPGRRGRLDVVDLGTQVG